MEETKNKSSHPEVFLGKVVLKLCSKFTGEHPCQSAISVKLLCNFIEITLQHGCSPVNSGADLGYVESVGLTDIFFVYNIY